MERVNQFSFYNFGKTLEQFERFLGKGDISTDDMFMPLMNARDEMEKLVRGDPIPLGISMTSAKDLARSFDVLWKEHFTYIDENGDERLKFPDDDDERIRSFEINYICNTKIREFETVFREEMREAAAYFVPKLGIFNTPDLVDKADKAFPEMILEHIPDKARVEWKAAGRCLAFNLLSASGFHVARAVESTLELYYQLYSGKEGDTLKGWAAYYTALEKIRKNGQVDPLPSEKTLVELDQMREDYRNPIVHPRVVLTEADAKMLFNNGETLIIAMAQEIKAIVENGGVQPNLPSLEMSAAPEPKVKKTQKTANDG